MQKQSLVAAIAFGVAGSLAAVLFNGSAIEGEKIPEIISAGVSAFVVGGLLWYKIALKKAATASLWRGTLVGGLIGFLTHPLFWYIFIVYGWAFESPTVGGPAMNPIQALLAALLYSVFSWTLAGWITVPVGAVTGGLLSALWPKPKFPAQTI